MFIYLSDLPFFLLMLMLFLIKCHYFHWLLPHFLPVSFLHQWLWCVHLKFQNLLLHHHLK